MKRFIAGIGIGLVVMAAGVARAGTASALILWHDEGVMIGSTVERTSFVYDPGVGNVMDHDRFATPQLVDIYGHNGFDRNFMLWAPIVQIPLPHRTWSRCPVLNHGGLCPTAPVEGRQLISDEFVTGPITVKKWGDAFIGVVCGNWSWGLTGVGPIPVISGVKYEDRNGNGIRDSGESGLPGWTIRLSYGGDEVAHATTGPDGTYTFHLDARSPAIGPGTYTLTEDLREGWVQSAAPAPVEIALGSADAHVSGRDFGNYRPATISGRKFEDMNADGDGAGDPGVSGWTVDYSGTASGAVETTADGSYSLAGLRPGNYVVAEQGRVGWTQSAPGGAGTHTVTVTSGEHVTGKDFGNWRPAAITGRKFDDHDVDGTGVGEPGLPGWTIALGDGRTRTTDVQGAYEFSGLRPGTYRVAETQQPGWRRTSPNPAERTVTIVSGQTLGDVDFGNVCLGTTTVKVAAGVSVRIEEVAVLGVLENEPVLPLTSTGTTSFTGLLPGTYRVTMVFPDNVHVTEPDLTVIDGRFALVRTVAVVECGTTVVEPKTATGTARKITGGALQISTPEGRATSGFEFMPKAGQPRGTLQFNDHARNVRIHTSDIDRISVTGTTGYVFGHLDLNGTTYAFRLRVVDAGEPGTSDEFELHVTNGYLIGRQQTLLGGNIQIH